MHFIGNLIAVLLFAVPLGVALYCGLRNRGI